MAGVAMYGIPAATVKALTAPDPDMWDESYYKALDQAGRRYRKEAQKLRDKDEADRKWKRKK